MPGSSISFFTDPDSLQAAVHAHCACHLLVTGKGHFRTAFRGIALSSLSLFQGEEWLPRIAFLRPAAGAVVILLPPSAGDPGQLWAGVSLRADELLTLHAMPGVHARTLGHTRTTAICCSAAYLRRVGRRLAGSRFLVPEGLVRWRVQPQRMASLAGLLRPVFRASTTSLGTPADLAAGRRLDREVADLLAEALSAAKIQPGGVGLTRRISTLARLEQLLEAGDQSALSQADLCLQLGTAARTLRAYTRDALGLSPGSYVRLYRLNEVRKALRRGGPDAASVIETARRYGFRQPGRFASAFRDHFGELPSDSLRRSRSLWRGL